MSLYTEGLSAKCLAIKFDVKISTITRTIKNTNLFRKSAI
jgi:transposase